MLIEFQQVPTFTEGQLLAAADLNTFNQNNTMIKKLFAAPQPLFMDSHAYAPKVLPLYWRSPDFTIWEGSFIYREGMRYAYLGFHVKLDGPQTTNGSEYPISKFGNTTDSVNIAIITKYTEFSYKNIYSASSTYSNYFASMPLYTEATQTKKSIYQFTIKDGSATNTDVNGAGYLTKNARISQIRIDLEALNLQDGELVPIKLMLLVNEDPRKSTRGNENFKTVYENFNNYFILRKTDPIPDGLVVTEGIFYSHLYAYTDGDLSYTDNWPSVSGVVTTGSGVLLTSNMQKLSGKQRYITDRLKNRPMPLTGAILYLSAYGGTSSVKYPQFDVVPGEWEYSKEEYAHSISNSMDEFAVGADNLLKTVQAAGRVNLHSNLATFAWNPAFELYNQPTLSFKFFGNTASRQVLIVDFTEAPVSQTSTRNNVIEVGAKQARSGHLFGYFGGSGASVAAHTGYYGSIYAEHDMTQFVTMPSSKKVYRNHLFQVRVPSPNTVVYSPETNTFTGSNGFFLTKGFWEDQVSITFSNETKGANKWGLFKSDSTSTLQFGFVGDIAATTVRDQYPLPGIAPEEFGKQYVRNTNYNDVNWNWYMDNGTKGHSQIFVNLYDHSNVHYRAKANYISYCFLVGFDDYKASDNVITLPQAYTGGTTLTYSGVVSAISTINSSLTESYNQLFVNNPHFQYYNMFWGAPKSTLNLRNIYKDYTDKFLFFTKQRTGNILIVRGKNVTMYYGEINELKRNGSPFGSLHKVDDVDVQFEYSESLISGDSEQTRIVHLSSIDKLAYNQRYYIQGETITYAAEFFEEPS